MKKSPANLSSRPAILVCLVAVLLWVVSVSAASINTTRHHSTAPALLPESTTASDTIEHEDQEHQIIQELQIELELQIEHILEHHLTAANTSSTSSTAQKLKEAYAAREATLQASHAAALVALEAAQAKERKEQRERHAAQVADLVGADYKKGHFTEEQRAQLQVLGATQHTESYLTRQAQWEKRKKLVSGHEQEIKKLQVEFSKASLMYQLGVLKGQKEETRKRGEVKAAVAVRGVKVPKLAPVRFPGSKNSTAIP
ncbi:hypothetical protein B0T17DRAFT_505219 [Bombardia bombarda]|uniref:Uncharacterized protein n=1 Tax=Bombardia bombarda TaxID=252184 RepID=A0AA39X7E6_9PEZI|nr:hypothetical protein B0T17DRAFT_505219 [Bombardia bombarda]